MERVRAFVGIDLPPACKETAVRLAAAVAAASPRPLTPVRAATVHLTLHFLGDVPASGPDGIEAVRAALAALAFAPFSLRFAGGGFFPDMARPRVVWAGLAAGAPECQALAARIATALAELGLPADDKPYRPHLTLARLRTPGRNDDWSPVLRLLTAATWPEIPVTQATLWRSILGPGGARHVVLSNFGAVAD